MDNIEPKSEFEKLTESILNFAKILNSIAPTIEVAVSALSGIGIDILDSDLFYKESDEYFMDDYVKFNDNKRSGFGSVIAVGNKTITIKVLDGTYVTVYKKEAKKRIPNDTKID